MKEKWDEVVQAYERELEFLEAARSRYQTAVDSLLVDLKSVFESAITRTPVTVEFEIGQPVISDDIFFAKRSVVCEFKAKAATWARISARIAAGWGGEPGLLDLVIEYLEPSQFLSWDRKDRDNFAIVAAQFAEQNNMGTEDILDFAHSRSLKRSVRIVDHEVAPVVLERLINFIGFVAAFVQYMLKETRCNRLMWDALLECKIELSSSPISQSRRLEPVGGGLDSWRDLYYIQLNPINRTVCPSIWIGYHPKEGHLYYCHNTKEGFPSLTESFARHMGCNSIEYGGSPAGILLNSDEVRRLAKDEIVKRCLGAFRGFAELTPETR